MKKTTIYTGEQVNIKTSIINIFVGYIASEILMKNHHLFTLLIIIYDRETSLYIKNIIYNLSCSVNPPT